MARHEPAGVYEDTVAYEGVTTSAGNAGGTTLIDSVLDQGTDYWKNMVVVILGGNSTKQSRRISGFTTATGTITVDTAFASQIASGTRFAILSQHDAFAGGGDATAANQVLILADTNAILVDTANMQPKLGTPAASISADIAAVKADSAAILIDTAEIGAAGAGLTALAQASVCTEARLAELAAANLPADVDTLKQRSITNVSMMEFWGDVDDIITLTTATANVDLPNVVVADIPANTTIVRVIGMIRIRAVNDTSGVANAINGAGVINVKKSTGAWGVDDVALITIPDNILSTSASTKEGGLTINGSNDAATEVDANATYNLRFNGNIFVDGNNLELIDVNVGLQVYFIAT